MGNSNKIYIGVLIAVIILNYALAGQNPTDVDDDKLKRVMIELKSSPDSGRISLSGKVTDSLTPSIFELIPDSYSIEVSRSGYESLSRTLDLSSGTWTSAEFILRESPPPLITAESLGLFYIPPKGMKDPKDADRIRGKFNRFAEAFAIIPFGQGVIGRFIADKDQREEADLMIISGAILSTTFYVLGKVFSAKKSREIERQNQIISEENSLIELQNKEVETTIKEVNDKASSEWKARNSSRGKVRISEEVP